MCGSYFFSFRVSGGAFDPEYLGFNLKLRAKYTRKKGDDILDKHGNRIGVVLESFGSFEPPQMVDDNLIASVELLMDRLESSKELLEEIRVFGSTFEIYVRFFSSDSTGERFPALLLHRLSRLGISLAVEFFPQQDQTRQSTEIREQ
ncbi:MAG TPA: hypothetical protein VIT91_21015 [Chthoniobacterales bacterium]